MSWGWMNWDLNPKILNNASHERNLHASAMHLVQMSEPRGCDVRDGEAMSFGGQDELDWYRDTHRSK